MPPGPGLGLELVPDIDKKFTATIRVSALDKAQDIDRMSTQAKGGTEMMKKTDGGAVLLGVALFGERGLCAGTPLNIAFTHPFVAVEHVLAGGEEGLRRRLRQDPGELPDDLHADGRLDRRAAGQHADGACRQAGCADHLDRRQQRLRRPHQGRPRQGHHRHRHQCRRHRRRQGQCPPGLHRPGLHPGRLHARRGAVEELSRRTVRSTFWSASRRPARTGRSSARRA